MIQSVFRSQPELMRALVNLHGAPQADVTFGLGGVWAGTGKSPAWKSDLRPKSANVIGADFTALPVDNEAFGSLLMDPPFLVGNGTGEIAWRYGSYPTLDALRVSYEAAICEAWRVLKFNGFLWFKCQDIHFNSRLRPTHFFIMEFAATLGFRIKDTAILWTGNRLDTQAIREGGRQEHLRIAHCHFLIFRKQRRAIPVF